MNMKAINIREKLHKFIDTIEDKKAEANYTLFEDEIEENDWEYTDEFRAELDRRYEYYKSGGKMISAAEAEEQISKVLQSDKEE